MIINLGIIMLVFVCIRCKTTCTVTQDAKPSIVTRVHCRAHGRLCRIQSFAFPCSCTRMMRPIARFSCPAATRVNGLSCRACWPTTEAASRRCLCLPRLVEPLGRNLCSCPCWECNINSRLITLVCLSR